MLSIVFMNKRSILTAVLALGLGVTALTGCATDSDSAHSDRKSTRLNSSHIQKSRMPSSA